MTPDAAPAAPMAVGIDLVEIARVERMLTRHGQRALDRLLCADERAYCTSKGRPAQHVAARLAAKEAAFKALQAAGGARHVGWRDSEVVVDDEGRPQLVLHGAAQDALHRLGARRALLSLTHADHTAAAVVILAP